MSTTVIRSVRFSGTSRELHELIGCWNVLKGVRWQITPVDYVGGCFDVTFTSSRGPISETEAKAWVDTALDNAA